MSDDDAPDGEMNSLEEQLRVYDDGFPREDPSWDEDSIVTPRAFLTEIGYDIPGAVIPGDLASFLIDMPATEEVVSLFRTFDTPAEFRETNSEHSVARLLDRGGLASVEVFNASHAGDAEDDDILAGYATGGYVVRYSYIRSDSEIDRTGHDRYGTYWMDVNGVTQLLTKLLCGGDEGPWSEEEQSQASYITPEWKQEANPAAHEQWTVARLSSRRHLNNRVAELAEENLLFGENVPREPMSSYEEMQANKAD